MTEHMIRDQKHPNFGNSRITCISPVYHIKKLHTQLLFLGTFLKKGLFCMGSVAEIVLTNKRNRKFMNFMSILKYDNCYLVHPVTLNPKVNLAPDSKPAVGG